MSVYKELEKLVKKGYLLHGSRKKFDIILPNKRKKLHASVGRYKAVYATDNPLVAMFFASIFPNKLPLIMGKVKCLKGYDFDKNENPYFALTPNIYKHHAFGEGYVYVANKQLFKSLKKIPHEYYSMKPVRPNFVFQIDPNEFIEMANHQMYPKSAVIEANFHTDEEIRAMGYD